MTYQDISNGGRAPKVTDYYVVALYEPATGTIRHLHTVTVFEGGTVVDENEAIRRARENALKAGHKTEDYAVKVSNNFDHGRRPHRIDPFTKSFVALEMKRKGNRARP